MQNKREEAIADHGWKKTKWRKLWKINLQKENKKTKKENLQKKKKRKKPTQIIFKTCKKTKKKEKKGVSYWNEKQSMEKKTITNEASTTN